MREPKRFFKGFGTFDTVRGKSEPHQLKNVLALVQYGTCSTGLSGVKKHSFIGRMFDNNFITFVIIYTSQKVVLPALFQLSKIQHFKTL